MNMILLTNESRYEIELKHKILELEEFICRYPTFTEQTRQKTLTDIAFIYQRIIDNKETS